MKKMYNNHSKEKTLWELSRKCVHTLQKSKINILDISQTIVQGYFNMMMVVDISEIEKDFKVICDEMEQMGEEIGVKIQCQKEEIFERCMDYVRISRDLDKETHLINMYEVSETNKMIEQENLDVRTITLGISLMDCIDLDLNELNRKIYEKITVTAKDLVSTGKDMKKRIWNSDRKQTNFYYTDCSDRRCCMQVSGRFCDHSRDTGSCGKRELELILSEDTLRWFPRE